METRSKKMMETLEGMKDVFGENMVGRDVTGGAPVDVPSERKGIAKVTPFEGGRLKDWLGQDKMIFVDVNNGEYTLMKPNGDRASLSGMEKMAHIEFVDTTP